MTGIRSVAEWFERHRRTLATAVALVACAAIGSELARHTPRDVALRYDLGPEHALVRSIEVEILDADDEPLRSARFGYATGAPRLVHDHVRLAPGTYVLRARITGEHLATEVARTLVVPTEGELRLELFDQATAGMPATSVNGASCYRRRAAGAVRYGKRGAGS